MAQVLRDYTVPPHSGVGQDVVSTRIIPLSFPVKRDFEEDLIKFDGNSCMTIYVIRFKLSNNALLHPKSVLLSVI